MDNRRGFRNLGYNGSAVDLHSRRNGHVHIPEFFRIQGIYLYTSGNIFSGPSGNFRKRPLYTVENIVQDSRTQGYGNGISCGSNCLSWFQAAGLLEDLYRSGILFQRNDLPYQVFLTHMDHLGHLKPGISF